MTWKSRLGKLNNYIYMQYAHCIHACLHADMHWHVKMVAWVVLYRIFLWRFETFALFLLFSSIPTLVLGRSLEIQRVPIPLLQSHSKFQRRKPAIVKSSHTAQLTMERLQSSGFCCMTIYISSPSKLIIEDHRHRAPCHLYHAPHTALIQSTEKCTPPTQCCHWWRRANRVTALPMATCHCRENQNNVKFLVGTMQTGFLPWGAFVS